MRVVVAALLTLISAPAFAASSNLLHDHIPLPPPSPAFQQSDGDRYGRLKQADNPMAQTDLDLLAKRMGASGQGGRVDVFKYPLEYDENGDALPGGAVTGTVANGAAQLQLRFPTQ